jgi:ComF family protein
MNNQRMSTGLFSRALKLADEFAQASGFAARCFCCRLGSGSAAGRLCEPCESACFDAPEVHRCPQCAARVSAAGLVCGQCLAAPRPFDACLCLGDYNIISRELVLRAKFSAEPLVAQWLDRADAAQLIIALPLSNAREQQRGYNQAQLIARGVQLGLKKRGLKIALNTEVLLRSKHTPAMSELPEEDRARAIAGAFACVQPLAGAQVWLVDDVMTTGSSLAEAARTLKKAGAARVTALVALRA